MKHNCLDSKLIAIGFKISEPKSLKRNKSEWLDLEETLISTSNEVAKESRLLSLILSWVKIHGDYVITEKLLKIASRAEAKDFTPWLSVVAAFAVNEGMHKWKLLAKKQRALTYLHDASLVESAIQLKVMRSISIH